MGLWERLFGKEKKIQSEQIDGFFQLLDGYVPRFRTWQGKIYESELVRAAIDAVARNASKLAVNVQGSAKPYLKTLLKRNPNEFSTWSQFLYRLTTILLVKNNAFVVPILGEFDEVTGIYPICPTEWELVQYKGEPFIRFSFGSQKEPIAIELSRVGILTRHQYNNDLFGESNAALNETMELIQIQRQGIEESAKNSATYRLMARVSNFTKDGDLAKERQRFDAENFQRGGGGILLLPNTYTDIHQLQQQSFNVDAEQLNVIKESVFQYFGVNQDILENKAYGDSYSAFYEGIIEPTIAIQLSEVLTRMLYTGREQASGAAITFTSNMLQYMTNTDKLSVSSQMVDRGIISLNEARDIWNLEPVEGGDIRIIRGEYYDVNNKLASQNAPDEQQS